MKTGQDQKARVLCEKVQAAPSLLRGPADPAIPGRELERGGLPAQQRNLGPAQRRDMAQALPEQAVERQVVMGRDQAVPATVLLRTVGGAHADGAQIQVAAARGQRLHPPQGDRSTTKCPALGWALFPLRPLKSREPAPARVGTQNGRASKWPPSARCSRSDGPVRGSARPRTAPDGAPGSCVPGRARPKSAGQSPPSAVRSPAGAWWAGSEWIDATPSAASTPRRSRTATGSWGPGHI